MIFYLLLILLVLLYTYSNLKSKIIFLSIKDSIKVLKFKPYFNKFNKIDLKVRNCTNSNQCMNSYSKYVKKFTKKEKKIITRYINKVKNHPILKPYNWKFIRVNDQIENGFPHTQKDCIIITDYFMNEIIKNNGSHTLIHEQIHVIQRLAPKKMHQHIKEVLNFNMVDNIKGLEQYKSKTRSNPDEHLSKFWIYKNKILPICLYSNNATQLGDASYFGFKIKNNEIISEPIPLHNFKEYEHKKLGKNNYNAYEVQAEYLMYLISQEIFN